MRPFDITSPILFLKSSGLKDAYSATNYQHYEHSKEKTIRQWFIGTMLLAPHLDAQDNLITGELMHTICHIYCQCACVMRTLQHLYRSVDFSVRLVISSVEVQI
jgi:hypothetical protein